MRKALQQIRILTIFLALLLSVHYAQGGDGIAFMTGNYTIAEKKAKEEQKLLLLDFTASWCMPCKKMEKEIFPNDALGEFVNDHFVSFKVNADYFWGMDIAKDYKVKAYPTILIVDNNGKVVKRIVGFQTVDNLMAELAPFRDFDQLFNSD